MFSPEASSPSYVGISRCVWREFSHLLRLIASLPWSGLGPAALVWVQDLHCIACISNHSLQPIDWLQAEWQSPSVWGLGLFLPGLLDDALVARELYLTQSLSHRARDLAISLARDLTKILHYTIRMVTNKPVCWALTQSARTCINVKYFLAKRQLFINIKRETRETDARVRLLESRLPVLLIAFSAVNRAALCRLERDFGFRAAVGADDLVHLSRTSVVTAPFSITHFFHSSWFSYT